MTQVTQRRQEALQARSAVSPRRTGVLDASDTFGPCPRQEAVSGTPLLHLEEEEEEGDPRDKRLGTAIPRQATQVSEGKSEGQSTALGR